MLMARLPPSAKRMSSKRINNGIRRKAAGAWLRQHRIRCGLTQHELAERVEIINYTMVSQIEGGKATIQSRDYEKWAIALELSLYELALYCTFYYQHEAYVCLFDRTEPSEIIRQRSAGRISVADATQ